MNPKEPKENPKREHAREKKPKQEKLTFGRFQNVKLTQQERDRLFAQFPDRAEEGIEILSAHLEAKGDKYKSHYATFFTWVIRAVDEHRAKNPRASPQTPGQRRFAANEQAAWEFINDPAIGARQ